MIFMGKASMGKPLLCRLGLHKWRNYGEEVEVFWHDRPRAMIYGPTYERARGEVVRERRKCKRCGIKLRRVLVTNPDGTVSCVGWEPDTEEVEEE